MLKINKEIKNFVLFLCSFFFFIDRKLEKNLSSESESENTLKFLSGEWFYEAKSRRHTDKIHGSEIILASIKQRSRGNGWQQYNHKILLTKS